MADFHYSPKGVCARSINFTIEDGIIRSVRFEGGCSGNTTGLSKLLEGMPADEAERRLSGIRCGFKPTSCPDQLARALREAMNKTE